MQSTVPQPTNRTTPPDRADTGSGRAPAIGTTVDHVPPGGLPPDGGVAAAVDRVLVRLDGLRDRPGFSTTLAALCGVLVALLWGLGHFGQPPPVDDRIPYLSQRSTVAETTSDSASDSGSTADGDTAAGGVWADAPPTTTAGPSPLAPTPSIVVHVSGAVANQGLYELAAGSRLADAIIAAGGESDGADVHRLNLATPLVDGMHIRVPTQGADPSDPALPLIELPTSTGAGSIGDPVVDGAGAGSPTRIDVNRAGVDELERLPGVGPAIAAAIVAWREDNGPFRTVDDLLAVPGIGPAKLSAMEDQVGL